MRYQLIDFQATAVDDIITGIRKSQAIHDEHGDHAAVVLNAVTGAGKTVIATAVIEQLLHGGDNTDPVDDTVILWVTDDPSLNVQTMRKMMAASEKLSSFQVIGQGAKIDQETFEPGTVYFLNIQAARRGATISKRSDTQRYTIWDTVSNTVAKYGSKFLVFVDEAHRGVEEKKSKDDATIVNKLVNGPSPVPVFIGITATTDKLDKSLKQEVEGAARTVRPVGVDLDAVRKSGLVKDRIVFNNPESDETGLAADTTLVRIGVRKTLEFERGWAAYAEAEGEKPVIPALVVQLPNSPAESDLREVVDAITEEWAGLPTRAIVNTFSEHQAIDLGSGRVIRYMAPQDIQDATDVRVVLAKNAVTTGWDCPRAEVLVSLRKSTEYTAIAQLIGRTVRQPLARRIERDESLNKVYCLLPQFDNTAVSRVAAQFSQGGTEPPADGVRLTLPYGRNAKVNGDLFDIIAGLPTYTVPGQSPTPQTKRLHSLAAALAHDGLDMDAPAEARRLLNKKLDDEAAELGPELEKLRHRVANVRLAERAVDADGQDITSESGTSDARLDANNIDDVYDRAAKNLRDGAAEAYWNHLVDDDEESAVEHKITVAALGMTPTVVEAVHNRAGELVDKWLAKHAKAIYDLPEARRTVYNRIREEARDPQPDELTVPAMIEDAVSVKDAGEQTDAGLRASIAADVHNHVGSHLYSDDAGNYYVKGLNKLERRVVDIELGDPNTAGWYRNPTGGSRALAVPYMDTARDRWAKLHPDFIFFHETNGQIRPSIVDPHGDYLSDSDDKLRGLIAYAAEHSTSYRSINPVVELDGQTLTLPIHDKMVRDKVLIALDKGEKPGKVYRELGVTYGAN